MLVHCRYKHFFTSGSTKKKARGEDKKRKHPASHAQAHDNDRRKKVKCEEDDSHLTEQDQQTLEQWKKIQQTTRPFPHPIKKVMKGVHGEVIDDVQYQQHRQELLFRQQAEELQKQRRQLLEQHKMIQEQQEHIKLLQEQRKALIQECQTAGVKLPQIVVDNVSPNSSVAVSVHSHPQAFAATPSLSQQSKVVHHVASRPVSQLQPLPLPPQAQQPLSTVPQLPPSSHHSLHQGPVLSPPMPQHPPPSIYPGVSPENCNPPARLPGPGHKPQLKTQNQSQQQQQQQQASQQQQQQLPPYPPQIHAHMNHLQLPTMHQSSSRSVSPGMNVISSSNSMIYSQQPPQVQMLVPCTNTFVSQPPRPHAAPPLPPPLPPSGMPMLSNIVRPSVSQADMMQPHPGAPHMSSRQPFGGNDPLRSEPSPMIRDLTFSPLTSSEFKELEGQSLASYSYKPYGCFRCISR